MENNKLEFGGSSFHLWLSGKQMKRSERVKKLGNGFYRNLTKLNFFFYKINRQLILYISKLFKLRSEILILKSEKMRKKVIILY